MTWTYKANLRGPRGADGLQGVQGLPGTGAVAADEAVAGYVSTSGTSATKTALLAGFQAKVTPFVEGVPLYSYGHSYTMYPNPYTSPLTGEYMERVRTRMKMGKGYFRGRSGTFLADTFCGMLSPAFIGASGASDARTWVVGGRGVVLIENYMNEVANTLGGSSVFVTGWKNALRSAIALTGTATKVTSTAASKTGVWTQQVGGSEVFSDADCFFSTEIGATMTFQVTGDECWVVGVVSDASYDSGAIEVKVGSTVLTTTVSQGQTATFTSTVSGAPRTYTPNAFKVTGMNAAAGTSGTKSLVLKVTEAKNTFVNCVLLPMVDPPHVFVAQEPTRNPSETSVSGQANFVANRPAFIAAVIAVCAEFPRAHVVELEPGWDNATMVGSLDTSNKFHPNDLGMQSIADNFVSAINAVVTEPIAGVMTL